MEPNDILVTAWSGPPEVHLNWIFKEIYSGFIGFLYREFIGFLNNDFGHHGLMVSEVHVL